MYSSARGVVGLIPPAKAELVRTIISAHTASSEQSNVFMANPYSSSDPGGHMCAGRDPIARGRGRVRDHDGEPRSCPQRPACANILRGVPIATRVASSYEERVALSGSSRGYEYGGPAFPGGIMAGIGIGILTDDFLGWLFVGIGAGFIAMAFIAALASRR
jgi:hypothetical protein